MTRDRPIARQNVYPMKPRGIGVCTDLFFSIFAHEVYLVVTFQQLIGAINLVWRYTNNEKTLESYSPKRVTWLINVLTSSSTSIFGPVEENNYDNVEEEEEVEEEPEEEQEEKEDSSSSVEEEKKTTWKKSSRSLKGENAKIMPKMLFSVPPYL